MTKNILLLAAVLGFVAQSSVFAADPTLREACRADVEQLGKKPVSTADLQLAVCASPVRVLEFYELLVVDATEPAAK
jgi:hypothetical protein